MIDKHTHDIMGYRQGHDCRLLQSTAELPIHTKHIGRISSNLNDQTAQVDEAVVAPTAIHSIGCFQSPFDADVVDGAAELGVPHPHDQAVNDLVR